MHFPGSEIFLSSPDAKTFCLMRVCLDLAAVFIYFCARRHPFVCWRKKCQTTQFPPIIHMRHVHCVAVDILGNKTQPGSEICMRWAFSVSPFHRKMRIWCEQYAFVCIDTL